MSASLNGYLNGQANGRNAADSKSSQEPSPVIIVHSTDQRRPSYVRRAFSVWSRLAIWYTILTLLFRCPSTPEELTSASPRVCRPYFTAKQSILPYVTPHYEKYASPYVESARPHYNRAVNTVVVPAVDYGKANYDKYGRQRVDLATAYGQKQWDSNVKPKIDKTSKLAMDQYQRNLAPHVDTVVKTSSPYFNQAKDGAFTTYGSYVLPAYVVAMPYVQQGYNTGYTLAAEQVFPHVKTAYHVLSDWIGRNAMPKLIILYGDNIEPQLIRIGERLGRYSDRKKLRSLVSSVEASFSTTESSASTETTASGTSAHSTASAGVKQQARVPDAKPQVDDKASRSTEIRQWQEKFAAAVNSGRADLEKRIADLVAKESDNAKSVGHALLVQLEETADAQVSAVKTAIKTIASKMSDDTDADEAVESRLQPVSRQAATAVKEKAHAIRQWSQKSSEQTQSLVDEATTSTLEILDGIRDLGLQDIGLRWSKATGVEHEEWAKYHAAKKTASEWRQQIQEHARIASTSELTREITDRGMQVTEDTAKELRRLREVGQWKIAAHDSSNDFSSKVLPPRAAKMASQASEAILGEATTASSSAGSIASGASKSAGGAASVVSDKIADVSDAMRSAVSASSSSASSVVNKATSSVVSVGSVASSSAKEFSDSAAETASSASAVGTTALSSLEASGSSMTESLAKSMPVQDTTSKLAAESKRASSALEESSSSLLSALSEASESATASPRVMLGAMAQEVKHTTVVYDDVVAESSNSEMSDQIQDFVSAAGDRWSDATRAVYQAILQPTDAQGSPISTMSSVAAEQYASALSAASVAIYGTTQGTGQSVASVASSRYSDAVFAASVAIYGTPTPVIESVASQASSVGATITDSALQQYAALSAMISELVAGKEPDFTESVMKRFSSVYYAGPFATAASSASSVASEAYASAESVAAEAYASVSSIVGVVSSAGDSVYSQVPSASDILDGVSSNVDSIVDAASAQVYGTPKGTVERAQESAASVYNEAKARASGAVYGTTKGSYEQMTSSASSAYSVALDSASVALYGTQKSQVEMAKESAASVYSDVLAKASEGVYGTKKKSVEAATSSANSVYSAALAQASAAIYGTKGSQMEAAKESAKSMYEEALAKASEGIYGTQAGVVEQAKSSVASVYEAAVVAASEAIYGTQKGAFDGATDSAGSAYAAATDSAASAYSAALAMAAEAAASASSMAASGVDSVSSIAMEAGSSVNSVASSVGSMASEQVSSGSSVASEAVYGSSTGSVESVASRVSEAVYGSSTGSVESIVNRASEAVSSVSKIVGETVSSVVSKVQDEL